MKCVRIGSAALVALVIGAAPAQSQAHFGLTGGVTVPTGEFGEAQGIGYSGGALLNFGVPAFPIGIRAEASLHHFMGKDYNIGGTTLNESANMWTAGVAGTYSLAIPTPIKPYLIAGMGMYGAKSSAPGAESVNKFGINAGAGMSFGMGGRSAFVEARWHRMNTEGAATTFIPLSFGITF
jgi:opacity protein-like surface antigen